MTAGKPWAAATERNREPILGILAKAFADRRHVLEVGSGTGQHAVAFAAALPHLTWQSSDRGENLPGIRQWLDDAALPNTPPALVFDVTQPEWPRGPFDGVFSANTLHIMGKDEVVRFFGGLPNLLAPDARVVVYGPFNYGGRFTSDSNAAFDASLRAGDPKRGIRDFEWIDGLAHAAGLTLLQDHAMPANNRCLVWSTA